MLTYPSAGNQEKKPIPSPLATATSVPDGFPWDKPVASSPLHTRHASAGAGFRPSPQLPHSRSTSGRIPQSSKLPPSSFKFPPSPTKETPELEADSFQNTPIEEPTKVSNTHDAFPPIQEQPPQKPSIYPSAVSRLISPERKPPLSRVFSLSSEAGTPRTSTDVYSSSNHSDETMASEIPSAGTIIKRPPFLRNSSSLAPPQRRSGPESLMMGFANVTGSFTVDGSLVSQAPFEEVKKRAVVGGQGGGGVVGVDQRKGQGGFFGGFSWGGVAESLSIGGLLGGDQQSSIREMKNTAQSNSVPLLSTPKSILFVDLRLAPGESRSYSYTFMLPRGLPPTHKGRAMKVSYNLVIGTQRAGSKGARGDQNIREVELPFRVFCGVDGRGEILGHDLTAPYIILRDQARSQQVELDAYGKPVPTQKASKPATASKSSEADFNSYVEKLLSSPRRNSSTGLISPTATTAPDFPSPGAATPSSAHSRRLSNYPLPPPPPTRVLVDSAIRMSTQPVPQREANNPTTSQTNFTIARGGRPIATLTLSRPALRLGDLLNLTLDFTTAAQSIQRTLVHAISLTLESTETIDPALSVRSASSVDRATRRVWDRRIIGGAAGGALGWCKRWSSSLKVPSNATPTFSTSGVEGKWVIRVEIVVGLQRRTSVGLGLGEGSEERLADGEDEEDDHQGEGAAARRARRDAEPASPSPSASENEKPSPHARKSSLRRTGSLKKPLPLSRQNSSNTSLSRSGSLARHRSLRKRPVPQPQDDDEELAAFARSRQLLERVLDDERGVTLAAVRRVPAEVFEIAVPIRVFGSVGVNGDVVGNDVGAEGLAI